MSILFATDTPHFGRSNAKSLARGNGTAVVIFFQQRSKGIFLIGLFNNTYGNVDLSLTSFDTASFIFIIIMLLLILHHFESLLFAAGQNSCEDINALW